MTFLLAAAAVSEPHESGVSGELRQEVERADAAADLVRFRAGGHRLGDKSEELGAGAESDRAEYGRDGGATGFEAGQSRRDEYGG